MRVEATNKINKISKQIDRSCTHTAAVVNNTRVTYAIFMYKPVVAALSLARKYIEDNSSTAIVISVPDGTALKVKEPLMFIEGNIEELAELEQLLLQYVGLSCICAQNAFNISQVGGSAFSFIDSHTQMQVNADYTELVSYGVFVGSSAAKVKNLNTLGFVGATTDIGARFFESSGLSVIRHSLIGYHGSTLDAAIAYHKKFPDNELIIPVSFFGQEITDTKTLVKHFGASSKVSILLDTHHNRFCEGLSYDASINIATEYTKKKFFNWHPDSDATMYGHGVSVAATIYLRQTLDKLNATNWSIIVDRNFDLDKISIFAEAKAPINKILTGSFLLNDWYKAHACAEIIRYDDRYSVRKGFEWLIDEHKNAIK